MAKTSKQVSRKKAAPPARSIEAREDQLISLAIDMAEEQLTNRTASPLVLSHYLKLATVRAQLEKEKLENENKLLQAKTDSLQSQKKMEEMYRDALNAMREYSGNSSTEYEIDQDV